MAVVEVPQTLKYRGGQLNAALVIEVENFTNWKKRFLCHIIGIESQFENIIKNAPFVPMTAVQRKPENQWTRDERKAANLDQRLKSLIMSVRLDDQMNFIINRLIAKSIWDDMILYHEGPSDVKESRVIDLKLCYNTFKFKEAKSLKQTFTRYKDLMNELVNDGIKLSKLEINIGFINGLPKKWLNFCQSLRNTKNVKDYELASLFGKLKYEKNLIDSIYETEKNKSLISTIPLSTAFVSSSIVQDFQDILDDEEDTRSNHDYLNDLEEEYQARDLLEKFKRFFKKGTQSKEGARNGEWVKISIRKYDIRKPIWSINHEKYTLFIVDEYSRYTSPKAIKFLKPSVDNINIDESEGYPPYEYLHPCEPFQRNKKDETRIVIKNKARLVAQCYNRQEGIDYNETLAPVARLEAIRIFLAFATYMNFIVYQMDVNSAFLSGKLKEEVYVKQPPGFESNEFPNHVFKLDKALYGLKQAP
nr:retrovirus-related Pol polyprotein from transposon TNT 1-94 [Tanacetum cinerariifolium]